MHAGVGPAVVGGDDDVAVRGHLHAVAVDELRPVELGLPAAFAFAVDGRQPQAVTQDPARRVRGDLADAAFDHEAPRAE